MRVENVMTRQPTTCSPEEDLASAASKMWTEDCGILPVVRNGEPQGVLTDRDVAMALAMRDAPARAVQVADVATGRLFACTPGDEVLDALRIMAEHRVRRLPVLDAGRLVGVVSLNDIVQEAASRPGKQKKPTYARIVAVLQTIGEHRKLPAVT